MIIDQAEAGRKESKVGYSRACSINVRASRLASHSARESPAASLEFLSGCS